MQEIQLLVQGTAQSDLRRRLRRLYRLDGRDRHPTVVQHAYESSWIWGINGGWSAQYNPRRHDISWGYLYLFDDETFGASRVCDVNTALERLGRRVDPEVEAPPPVRTEAQRILDELLSEIRAPITASWATPQTVTYDFQSYTPAVNATDFGTWDEPGVIRWTTSAPAYRVVPGTWRFDYTPEEDERF